MAAHQVLFCPFCRESFEDLIRCPDHELTLVPLDRLPQASHEHELDDLPAASPAAAWWDPRSGRGMVALAALLNTGALLLPLAKPANGALGKHSTLALCEVFPVLWTLILVSFTIFFVLARRRTPRELASVRLLIPALALVSPIALAIVGHRLGYGPSALVFGADVGPGPAVVAVILASLLMVVGGLRLGAPRGGPADASAYD